MEYAFTGDELFDPQYYLGSNIIPDGMNPFTDYIENGYRAGRNPSALFNVSYYLSQNSDVRNAGDDPLKHYATFGYAEDHENLDPSAVFDSSYYNENNSDVVDEKMPSLLHYILFGDGENLNSRNPNPAFDNSYYNQMNPDVAKSDMTALEHYMLFGWKESRPDHPKYNPNRNPSAFLNSTDYFILNNDVLTASYEYDSANPLQHLLEFGFGENRLTHKMFESENILKFTKVITPDSDPQDISNLKQAFKNKNYDLNVKDDNKFEIREVNFDTDSSPSYTATRILSTTFIGGTPSPQNAANGDDFDWQFNFDENSSDFPQSSTLYSHLILILRGEFAGEEAIIDFANPDLSDLLSGTSSFSGQAESQTAVEVFQSPTIEEFENLDLNILPEDALIFIPTTTEFAQPDENVTALIQSGLFLTEDDVPEGASVFTTTRNGTNFGYNPEALANSPDQDWNGQIAANGELNIDLENSNTLVDQLITVPARVPNRVRDQQGLRKDQTRGLFIDPNGNTIQLKSVRAREGDIKSRATIATEAEFNRIFAGSIPDAILDSFTHAEGNAASIVRQLNLPSGTIVINHEAGPCSICREAIPKILKRNQILEVIYSTDGGTTVFVDTYRGGEVFNQITDRQKIPVDF